MSPTMFYFFQFFSFGVVTTAQKLSIMVGVLQTSNVDLSCCSRSNNVHGISIARKLI